jgi:hypothetical protein
MLLHPFVAGLNDAVLIADDLKRCRGDAFLEMIVQRFNPEGAEPTFRHVTQVSSSLRQYQCLQVCDLLLGCVLNNLAPPGNQYKIDIRTYLCEKLDVSNFLRTTWRDIRLDDVIASCPSFHVWYWNAKKKPR